MSVIVNSGTFSPSNCFANKSWACCAFDCPTVSDAPGIGVVAGVIRAPGAGKSKSAAKGEGDRAACRFSALSALAASSNRRRAAVASVTIEAYGPLAETVVISILA